MTNRQEENDLSKFGTTDLSFEEVGHVHGELNPGNISKDFHVDPVSSQIASSKELQEAKRKTDAKEREKKRNEKKDDVHTLKSAIIISGMTVAVIGVIFAVAKNLERIKSK
ncbi:hypothetical protein GIB67_013625 [Kingdonia uniflora]|uniref:Transmembrane protein n=1 Tax=Kingdonia uniflora TaxID=39325 RepID=A0A7J7NPS8_9MAGN|nr:hypothetical protein GIB67_013625 [Kingdonia uniflora]